MRKPVITAVGVHLLFFYLALLLSFSLPTLLPPEFGVLAALIGATFPLAILAMTKERQMRRILLTLTGFHLVFWFLVFPLTLTLPSLLPPEFNVCATLIGAGAFAIPLAIFHVLLALLAETRLDSALVFLNFFLTFGPLPL